MKAFIPISLKRIVAKHLNEVEKGSLSKEQAEMMIKRESRYSSKTRQDIIAHLTRQYDQQTVEEFQFFRLL
jgi:hypothetical protein